jgi:hypothetical protein
MEVFEMSSGGQGDYGQGGGGAGSSSGSAGSDGQQGTGGTEEQGGGSGQGPFWYVGESRPCSSCPWTALDSAEDNPSMIALQTKYRTMDNQYDYHIIKAGSATGEVWFLARGFANGYQNPDGSPIKSTFTDCPEGQVWDEAKQSCVHIVPTCPDGQYWDWKESKCMVRTTTDGGGASLENMDAIVAIILVCVMIGVVAWAVM